jgi:hypothetical protein
VTQYQWLGYPRFTTPDIVDWIDYRAAVDAITPMAAAQRVARLAGDKPFYLVWSVGYGFHNVCTEFRADLIRVSGRRPTSLVLGEKLVFYQSMNLLAFAPGTPARHP